MLDYTTVQLPKLHYNTTQYNTHTNLHHTTSLPDVWIARLSIASLIHHTPQNTSIKTGSKTCLGLSKKVGWGVFIGVWGMEGGRTF